MADSDSSLLTTAGTRGARARARLDAVLARGEKLAGRLPTALAVGLALLAAAACYVAPAATPVHHGGDFAILSVAPFDLSIDSPVRNRLLAPALGWLLRLNGARFVYLPWLFGALFLALVYGEARARGLSPSEALGLAALPAFSTPILFALYAPGYTDTLSCFFLGLALATIRRPLLWPLCFAAALLNHESNLVAAPWLLALAWGGRPTARQALGGLAQLAAALAPLAAYRWWVGAHAAVKYALDYYSLARGSLFNENVDYAPLAVLASFRLFWLFPLAAAAARWRAGDRKTAAWFALVVVCALARLAVASDSSRLMDAAFPAILGGALVAREAWGPAVFAKRLWALIGLNLLLPALYVGQTNVYAMVSWPVAAWRAQQTPAAASPDLLTDDSPFLATRLEKGTQLTAAGRWREALQTYDDALAVAPDYAPILLNRSRLRAALGDAEGALTDLRRLLDRKPCHERALAQLGRLVVLAPSPRLTAEAAQRLDQSPCAVAVLLGEAMACEEQGRLADAARAYREFLARAPDHPWAGELRRRLAALASP